MFIYQADSVLEEIITELWLVLRYEYSQTRRETKQRKTAPVSTQIALWHTSKDKGRNSRNYHETIVCFFKFLLKVSR